MSTGGVENLRRPLGERLVAEALAIAADQGGPDGVSLREVQRRTGVSPAAAYRHFKDREALLLAVAQEAAGRLADHLAAVMTHPEDDPSDLEAAKQRLLAGCQAYLDFAVDNPGLYRAIFVSGEQLDDLRRPSERARGGGEDGGYNLLVNAVQDVVTAAGGAAADPWDAVTVWSTCHGLAMLRLDAALRTLPPDVFTAARRRVLGTVVDAVAAPVSSPDTPVAGGVSPSADVSASASLGRGGTVGG